MIDGIRLDYQELRTISPQAARKAILQMLKATNGNVSETAKLLNTTRRTIYKAMRKDTAGDLDDAVTAPVHVHNKTAKEFEEKVIQIKQQTRFGPE